MSVAINRPWALRSAFKGRVLASSGLLALIVLFGPQASAQAAMDWAAAADHAATLSGRRWQAFGQGLWGDKVERAAQRFGVPKALIFEVMRIESAGRAYEGGQALTSSAGAIGLMQVMPRTYEQLRQVHGLGRDPGDPGDNILAGTAYLKRMGDRFGYPGLLAAYNAGPQRLEAHLAGQASLPQETITYLGRFGVWPQFQAWVRQVQQAKGQGLEQGRQGVARASSGPQRRLWTVQNDPMVLVIPRPAKGLFFHLPAEQVSSGPGELLIVDPARAQISSGEEDVQAQGLSDHRHGGG